MNLLYKNILETDQKISKIEKIAVIIKGNPKIIGEERYKQISKNFYNEIKEFLENYNYYVIFNPGSRYTLPPFNTDLWIAHSRGSDRIKAALKYKFEETKHIKMIVFGGDINASAYNFIQKNNRIIKIITHPKDTHLNNDSVFNPEHYIFTDRMKKELDKLIKE